MKEGNLGRLEGGNYVSSHVWKGRGVSLPWILPQIRGMAGQRTSGIYMHRYAR